MSGSDNDEESFVDIKNNCFEETYNTELENEKYNLEKYFSKIYNYCISFYNL